MKPGNQNSYNSLKTISINDRDYKYSSLVEAEKNGLDGISKLPKGGSIDVNSEIKHQLLEIKISNDGKFEENSISDSGFGLKNSIERLKYLFGNTSSISINNENNKVVTRVIIPKNSII